jgi:hypothetical protein
VISPLLANLFLPYACDVWMAKQFSEVPFERYCDDAVVRCKTQKQAQFVRDAIGARLATVGWSCIRTKHASCTARMATVVLRTPMSGLISSGYTCVHAFHEVKLANAS